MHEARSCASRFRAKGDSSQELAMSRSLRVTMKVVFREILFQGH